MTDPAPGGEAGAVSPRPTGRECGAGVVLHLPRTPARVAVMKEAFLQTFENLRANKLRSFLTMFGILWGVISVVILSATGEGFRQGNEHVLRELGKNIGIVWGGRTSKQAGGERAGRRIWLTVDDARAIKAEAHLVAVATPEIQRGAIKVKSRYNAAAPQVHGIEPPYQDIRTLDLEMRPSAELGRRAAGAPRGAHRRRPLRAVVRKAQSPRRRDHAERHPLRHRREDSEEGAGQQLQRSRQRQAVRAVRGDGAGLSSAGCAARCRVEHHRRAEAGRRGRAAGHPRRTHRPHRRHRLAAGAATSAPCWPGRHGFDPTDREAIWMWDTSVNSLMFGRMVDTMRNFFVTVGFITLALGGVGVMNIMLIAVKERTREIGVRKALGATTRADPAAVLPRRLLHDDASAASIGLDGGTRACAPPSTLLPMPTAFHGDDPVASAAVVTALCRWCSIGVVTSLLPARRAAELPPVEALRYEM